MNHLTVDQAWTRQDIAEKAKLHYTTDANGPVWLPERAGTLGRSMDKKRDTAETILVVDDEEEVRGVIVGILGEIGFQVIEASSGPEALDLCARFRGRIHLLLTDLIMPGMTGRQLADTLSALRPGLNVIFMSGHIDGSRQEALEPGLQYIQKPVDWSALESAVRSALKQSSKGY